MSDHMSCPKCGFSCEIESWTEYQIEEDWRQECAATGVTVTAGEFTKDQPGETVQVGICTHCKSRIFLNAT